MCYYGKEKSRKNIRSTVAGSWRWGGEFTTNGHKGLSYISILVVVT